MAVKSIPSLDLATRSTMSCCRAQPAYSTRNAIRWMQTTSIRHANPLPITGAGPPPAAPVPPASEPASRVDWRRRQAELLQRGNDSLRPPAASSKPSGALKRRFWKDVSVQTTSGGDFCIQLDTRPVRHPQTKQPLRIPASKPHLATAIALEWDLLTSAQQALKPHLVPLTSLAARAIDIERDDEASAASTDGGRIRQDVVRTVMRCLDTDTLLCWAPAVQPPYAGSPPEPPESLHSLQSATAAPIAGHLMRHVWPGTQLQPAMPDAGGGITSILPRPQSETTHAVARGWASGLGAWELAGLERAVLAGKSLCVGARLVSEWSEGGAGIPGGAEGNRSRNGEFGETEKGEVQEERFGAQEAARACSLEVRWQTGMWGEVEDSHDVDREDLGRQMGSVVLLVSGQGSS